MSYITLATATGLFLLVLNPKFVNIIDNNMQICHRERCFWFCKRTTEFSLCLVYLFFSFSISLARCKKTSPTMRDEKIVMRVKKRKIMITRKLCLILEENTCVCFMQVYDKAIGN